MKSLKKIMSIVFVFVAVLVVSAGLMASQAASSSLTEVPQGYTGIYTKADLDNVRNNLAGNYILMNDIVFTAEDFAEGGAYYNEGKGWTPIGTDQSAAFSGIFDGNGYAIKNLKIRADGAKYVGLFGYLYGSLEKTAEVKNLGMVNCDISAATDGARVGAIVGYSYYPVSFDRCYGTGTVSADGDIDTIPVVGGLVGLLDIGGSITNCYNECTVESSYEAGGIVGSLWTGTTAEGCCNFGTVRGSSFVGGICGDNSAAKVINCANFGPVEAIPKAEGAPARIGGIASVSQSSSFGSCIENCINTASVPAGEMSGAILGLNHANIPVSDCYYLDSSDKGIGSGTDTATKCTYEEMTKKATFAGFDFDVVWEIGENGRLFPSLKALNLSACTEQIWSAWTESSPAKCEVPGEKWRYCTACGRVEKGTVDALQHLFGDWDETTAPKCGVAGEETRTCTRPGCGHPETRPVTALKHLWNDGKVTEASSCVKMGVKVYACTQKGCEQTKEEDVPLAEHSFGAWKTVTPATCTEAGVQERVCAVCTKEKETKAIDALGHDFEDPTVTKEPTCTEEGTVGGFCTRCESETAQSVPAKGHSFGVWAVSLAPTCTAVGSETAKCTVCEEETSREIAATGHSFGAETVIEPATSTKEGVKERKCTACGETVREAIPLLTDSSVSRPTDESSGEDGAFPWILLVLGVVLLGAGGLCWYFLFYKKARKN